MLTEPQTRQTINRIFKQRTLSDGVRLVGISEQLGEGVYLVDMGEHMEALTLEEMYLHPDLWEKPVIRGKAVASICFASDEQKNLCRGRDERFYHANTIDTTEGYYLFT